MYNGLIEAGKIAVSSCERKDYKLAFQGAGLVHNGRIQGILGRYDNYMRSINGSEKPIVINRLTLHCA